jgi:hypothetical protein
MAEGAVIGGSKGACAKAAPAIRTNSVNGSNRIARRNILAILKMQQQRRCQ